MEKIELLKKEHPEELTNVVNTLYKIMYPILKKKKTICHFKVMGKKYTENIFVKNYINFLKDIAKIHGYEMFKECIPACFIRKDKEKFLPSTLDKNQISQIGERIFISTYSSTGKKLKHIKNICELLEMELKFY
jgi:hypothetical protein